MPSTGHGPFPSAVHGVAPFDFAVVPFGFAGLVQEQIRSRRTLYDALVAIVASTGIAEDYLGDYANEEIAKPTLFTRRT